MDPNKIGNFIKKLRKDNNQTQQDFAEMFGVTYQAVSKWENGKNIPDILILKEICKKFNIDINEILDGEKKKKTYYKQLIIIISIILISLITIFILNKNDDFEFKTLSSSCSNFNITGSIAYNSNKSHIYISNIEYCGGNDTTEYEKIECILYESSNNIDTKIDSYTSLKNIKLEQFLKDLKFHVDNHSGACKDFIESNVFLQINAIDKDNNIISYKIPLDFEESCYID
ncbi:MAG: helix-turn-helix transcriptional regulator [Bacilli bacterium]|nr:helix-turn-helix transcriptional regulator [Bacilli bacterium]